MIDLRYLGLTLIGVFLALAIGLMTGSALGSPERTEAAYDALRKEFELLRTENQRVREENDGFRRRLTSRDLALREFLPAAVRGRLAGSTVGIVICGPVDERRFWSELESALKLSGAEIGPVVRVPDRLRAMSPDIRNRLGRLWEGDALSHEPDPYEAAGWMVRALARGAPRAQVEELARAAGIEVRGEDAGPVRRILMLTGIPDDQRAAILAAGTVPEVRVVDAARQEGVRAVAAEPEEAATSAVDLLRRYGVTTVDNIDTSSGQISAVLALSGHEGQFGSKPGAARPIPPLQSP
jgi:copper transport outer membrane protein MctB